jgi:hypothetical protein
MKRQSAVVILAVLIVVLLAAVGSVSYDTMGGKTTTTSMVENNTFFTSSCSISGVGGFGFRIVSDSTGATVNGATVRTVDGLVGCDETQIVYLDNFSSVQGWLIPVFPSNAVPAGGLNFTVTYQGRTFNFGSFVPAVGANCVTLHVPSGNVTTRWVTSGNVSCS